MNRKTVVLWVVGIVISLFLLTSLIDFLLSYKRPKFQNKLVEEAKRNEALMGRIGGYKNHEFSYSQKDLERDSLRFELVIFGGDNLLTFEGWATKISDNEWRVKRIQSQIAKY